MSNALYRLTVLMLLLVCSFVADAQNVTGIWRGHFTSEFGDQYKIEVQVEQTRKKGLTGVTYSYLTTVFYGKATVTGFVKTASKKVLIQEIKTVELKMSGGSVACIMKYDLAYTKSGKEEFLEGSYSSIYERSALGSKRGESCGNGIVFLRKVRTSDFYVEPFLRDNPIKDPVVKAPVKKPITTKPPAQNNTRPPAQKQETKTPDKPVKKGPTEIKRDTVQQKRIDPIVINTPKIEKPKLTVPVTTRSRNNELTQTFVVKNDQVIVKLYDNGEVDGDTVTVYMDGKPVISSKMLSTVPLTITLKMDEDNTEHVLVMVAENLGRIPPNTSLMVVHDGDKRYEVRITSTEQKNAMVRFRYEK
jgi:hypothetical protein